MSAVVLLSSVLLLLQTGVHSTVTVLVDPLGGDDSNCQSVQDLLAANLTSSPTPCRSLDRALGGSGDVSSCVDVESCSSGLLDGVVEGVWIRLADGEHRLNGE